MNRCPITYEPSEAGIYSLAGLRKLSPKLTTLDIFPFTAQEQRQEAASRARKMSIQGVQPKISARLQIKNHRFEAVDIGGTYILKPQSDIFIQTPENEDITMRLAKLIGIDVPLHGMIYSKDNSMTYFIKRFDRYGKNKRLPLEDFTQLTGNTRDTKYKWSMEKLIPVLDQFCTFPAVEKRRLFHRVIFCFLTGNEDMHLKNFSLITKNGKVSLSPAYDLINSSIAMPAYEEEIALTLNGKKNNLKSEDFIEYFGMERLGLTKKSIHTSLKKFKSERESMFQLIDISFLSQEMKQKYKDLLMQRFERLKLTQ